MEPLHARAYVERRWRNAEELKREHWAREFEAHGPAATLRASHALWRHVRLLRPDWPSEADRQDDLAHHVALKRRIDRAARAFAVPGR
jgi:hypothetical protein